MGKSEIHRRDFMKYTGIGLSGMAIPGLAVGCRNGLAPVAASKSPSRQSMRRFVILFSSIHMSTWKMNQYGCDSR